MSALCRGRKRSISLLRLSSYRLHALFGIARSKQKILPRNFNLG